MENTNKKLTVVMLNGFFIANGDDFLPLEKFGNSKLLELLQILLRHGKRGISRTQLLQMLYDDDSVNDKSHSLDSLVYRLKQTMIQSGMVQNEFLLIKKGIYKWSESFHVEVDVHEFEDMVGKAEIANDDERYSYLVNAFYLYEEEFLSERPERPWMLEERRHLKKLYQSCIYSLGAIFENEKKYQELYELYAKAADLYPYDEWQAWQILALQYMDQFKEAYELYEATVRMYSEDLGLPLSQNMLDIIQKMSHNILNSVDSLSDIKARLDEDVENSGAFYCSYPSFIDIYRVVSRMVERSGQSVFFMVCGISYLNPTGRKSVKAGDMLKEAIGTALRKGDSYTRYSNHQYLILLSGTKNENCEMIFERIRREFKKRNRNSNCDLDYFYSEVHNTFEAGETITFKNKKSFW